MYKYTSSFEIILKLRDFPRSALARLESREHIELSPLIIAIVLCIWVDKARDLEREGGGREREREVLQYIYRKRLAAWDSIYRHGPLISVLRSALTCSAL